MTWLLVYTLNRYYTHIYTHTHKGTLYKQRPIDWHTHINILTPPVMCSWQLSALHYIYE